MINGIIGGIISGIINKKRCNIKNNKLKKNFILIRMRYVSSLNYTDLILALDRLSSVVNPIPEVYLAKRIFFES